MKRTREGFGHGLLDLGQKRPDVVVLVGDLSGSTNVSFFAEKFPIGSSRWAWPSRT